MGKKRKKGARKAKIEKIPSEAKEEPKILQHSKYEDPVIKTKSRYDEDEETRADEE